MSLSKLDFIDLLIAQKNHDEKYFQDYRKYASTIKEIVDNEMPGGNLRVLVFGSVVKGTWTPNKSDIDVLVISERVKLVSKWQSDLRRKIFEKLGDRFAPFEIHFATPQLFENWYSRFIKNSFIEV